ncbi:MAG: AbrB/MazE/SpoVT family DNA-binding domain-containing protein [Nitrososphaerota archaeon]
MELISIVVVRIISKTTKSLQMTIPLEVVEKFGLKPGDKLAVYIREDEIVMKPLRRSTT